MNNRQIAYDLLERADALRREAYLLLETVTDEEKTQILDNKTLKTIGTTRLTIGDYILSKYRVISKVGDFAYITINEDTQEMCLVKMGRGEDTLIEKGYEIAKKLKSINNAYNKPIELVFTDEITYAVYKYIPGESLDIAMSYLKDAEKVMLALCDRVSELHAKGYIHRDIKPANIVVDLNGDIHLIDFDIALELQDGEHAVNIPAIGSIGYASPETYTKGAIVDRTVDVYGLGMVYADLLGGKTNDIIKKATNRNPKDRYQTASEMAKDIKEYMNTR